MRMPADVETLSTTFDTTFTWDYGHHDAGLGRLYDHAKRDQWDGATTLDWTRNVEPEAENLPDSQIAIYGSPMGMPADECCAYALASPSMVEFRRMLFSKIVPNVKKLGLLDDWLRERFAGLGILQYEDLEASDVAVLAAEPEYAQAH